MSIQVQTARRFMMMSYFVMILQAVFHSIENIVLR